METLTGTDLKLHTTCDTLPIFSFYQIIKTDDLRFLVKDFFGGDLVVDFIHTDYLNELFEKIVKEYNSVCATEKEFKNLRKEAHITYMESEYTIVTDILKLYSKYTDIAVLKLLDEVGRGFDFARPIGVQIDELGKEMIGLRMKIKIAKSNFVINNKNKAEKIDNFDIEQECLYLEQNLELGYQLNPKEISCTRFAMMKKMQKEKKDYYEKQINNVNG